MGENPYKAVYSILSLAGLVLIGFGFADYRSDGLIPVWFPPFWMNHMALLLNWFALVFFVAAFLPCYIRRTLQHPMLTGVMVWAMAHLLTNGDVGGMILFGAFLLWAVVVRIDIGFRAVDKKPAKASILFDFLALVIGSVSYAIIVFWLHPHIFYIPVWPG
jgi:uncharacterized membrane protein